MPICEYFQIYSMSLKRGREYYFSRSQREVPRDFCKKTAKATPALKAPDEGVEAVEKAQKQPVFRYNGSTQQGDVVDAKIHPL